MQAVARHIMLLAPEALSPVRTRRVGLSRKDEMLIDAAALRRHVHCLAGDIGERNVFRPEALAAAAAYIEDTWRQQGYAVRRQNYDAMGVDCANLEVIRQGSRSDGGILLLGAHYDSVRGSPGANDNASGVAALLEISRSFIETVPSMTVRFVAFVNEEPPFLIFGKQGSRIYAKAARSTGDDIRLMVALETMGYYCDAPECQHYPPFFRHFYPDRGNFLGFVSNFRSRGLMRRAVRCFHDVSDFPLEHIATLGIVPGVSWSDHRAFWQEGYRAFMVTDTAPYRYPFYHSSDDTPDKLSYDAFARATDGLIGCFTAIARSGVAKDAR